MHTFHLLIPVGPTVHTWISKFHLLIPVGPTVHMWHWSHRPPKLYVPLVLYVAIIFFYKKKYTWESNPVHEHLRKKLYHHATKIFEWELVFLLIVLYAVNPERTRRPWRHHVAHTHSAVSCFIISHVGLFPTRWFGSESPWIVDLRLCPHYMCVVVLYRYERGVSQSKPQENSQE